MSSSLSSFDVMQTAAQRLSANQAEEACDALEPLVDAAPDYAAAQVLLARACEQAGDFEGARRAWDRAAQLVPTSPLVRRLRKESPPSSSSGAGLRESKERGWAIVSEEEHVPHDDDASSVEPEPMAPSGEEDERIPVRDIEDSSTEESFSTEEEVSAEDDASIETPDALSGELDDLISRLENASRIKPDPDFKGPEVEVAAETPPDLVSETLAGVYVEQGQYQKAAETYEQLAEQIPERAEDFKQRAAEMRSKQ